MQIKKKMNYNNRKNQKNKKKMMKMKIPNYKIYSI